MMTSLTPWVKRLMITWVGLWVVSFLFYLGDYALQVHFGLFPAALAEGMATSFLGLFSYAFLHETPGIWHLAINSLVLYWTGPEIERYFPGRKFLRFLAIVIGVGAVTRVGFYFLVGGEFSGPAVGGSGVTMACLAGLAALQPGIRVNLIFFSVQLLPLFLVLIGLDVLNLLATFASKGSSVASELHLAGAAVGWSWAGGFHRFPVFAKMTAKRQQAKQQKHAERRRNDEQELDRILAKISRDGIGKLTPAEKKFLDKRSRRPD